MPVLEQPSDMLREFCHGDLDAFEALFRQHQGEVHDWIVHIVRDPAAAEDLTVETF
jgi:DNA-directed RNA polymerase specialized sigma24 family protein